MRQRLRSFAERRAPGLATTFRVVREELRSVRLRPAATPFGFVLVGDPSMQDGSFERQETDIIRRYLPEIDVFVDIGANVGFYACLARSVGKQVVAIEPLTANLRLLYANLRTNGWTDVEVWPVAVAAASGVIDLYGGATGASVEPGWAGTSLAYRQPVAMTTLDTLLGERFAGRRLFIKIDVEGAEFSVLGGAIGILRGSPKPVWLVEITLTENRLVNNPHFAGTFARFREHGYDAWTADANRRPVGEADVRQWVALGKCDVGVYNWLFVPRAGT